MTCMCVCAGHGDIVTAGGVHSACPVCAHVQGLVTPSRLGQLHSAWHVCACVQGLVALSRLGVYIRLPGVDVAKFEQSMQGGGLLGYIDTLSGGSLSKVGVFSLGTLRCLLQWSNCWTALSHQIKQFLLTADCLHQCRHEHLCSRTHVAGVLIGTDAHLDKAPHVCTGSQIANPQLL